MDKLSPAQRSENMAKVKGKNTAPEMRVRKLLHAMGYRFRLHRKDLPGKPDIVLPKHNLCIFVHGCFWHQHSKCRRASIPTSNAEFWNTKLTRTVERDHGNIQALKKKAWGVIVIWECETTKQTVLKKILLGKMRSTS